MDFRGYLSLYSQLTASGASVFTHTSSRALPLHLAASSGSHVVCERISTDMTSQEAIRRFRKKEPLKESILESTDQDGSNDSLEYLLPDLGMTAIDLALSSGYKSLASRLGQWTYSDARTLVSLSSSCFLILFSSRFWV
jgi:hypothetical protein